MSDLLKQSLIRRIGLDLGKQTMFYIETTHPDLKLTAGQTLAIRNAVYAAFMEAVTAADHNEVEAMLHRHELTRKQTIRPGHSTEA